MPGDAASLARSEKPSRSHHRSVQDAQLITQRHSGEPCVYFHQTNQHRAAVCLIRSLIKCVSWKVILNSIYQKYYRKIRNNWSEKHPHRVSVCSRLKYCSGKPQRGCHKHPGKGEENVDSPVSMGNLDWSKATGLQYGLRQLLSQMKFPNFMMLTKDSFQLAILANDQKGLFAFMCFLDLTEVWILMKLPQVWSAQTSLDAMQLCSSQTCGKAYWEFLNGVSLIYPQPFCFYFTNPCNQVLSPLNLISNLVW